MDEPTNQTLMDADVYTSCVLMVALSIISMLDKKRIILTEEIIEEINRQIDAMPSGGSKEAKYVQENAHKMARELCANLQQNSS